MVGILFARPDSPLAKSDIIPSMPFFHDLSDNHIDFFCAGYGVEKVGVIERRLLKRGDGAEATPRQ